MFKHTLSRQWICRVVRQQLGQVGSGMLELHNQRRIVGRADPKGGRGQLTRGDRVRVLKDPEVVRVVRSRFGIEEAAPRENEILCTHLSAVGPEMWTNMERPGLAIARNRPTRRGAGDRA